MCESQIRGDGREKKNRVWRLKVYKLFQKICNSKADPQIYVQVFLRNQGKDCSPSDLEA